jgi:hypothetical protein
MAFPAAALRLWSILPCLLVLRAEAGQPREESLYLWIDAHQARVLIGKTPAGSTVLSARSRSPSNKGYLLVVCFETSTCKGDCSPPFNPILSIRNLQKKNQS